MPSEQILFEKLGPRATITFNRPEARNAMTWAMYDRLEALCGDIDSDPEIRVVRLRGAGGQAFVAGTDISQFAEFRSEQDPLDYERRIGRITERLESLSKPTVALLEGYCVGGGAAIALCCDSRYATPDLQFGVPIARTLGNCLATDNVARLMDLVGPARTKEVLMLARLLGAEELHTAGAINGVFPAESIDAEVQAVTDKLASLAPLTLRASKEAVRRIQQHRRVPPEAGEDLILSCYMSEDFREAVSAFTGKRRHAWLGR